MYYLLLLLAELEIVVKNVVAHHCITVSIFIKLLASLKFLERKEEQFCFYFGGWVVVNLQKKINTQTC